MTAASSRAFASRTCATQATLRSWLPSMTARRRAERPGWDVFSHGGRRATGKDAVEWAVLGERLGAGEILLTSMDNDGVQDGYDVTLLKAVSSAVRLPVIASGGAGTAAHMYEALTAGGAEAALAASIFHFGELSIRAVKEDLAAPRLQLTRSTQPSPSVPR